MKYALTCNDAVLRMVRERVTVSAEDLNDAFAKAKKKFSRKHRTQICNIDITAVERVDD